MAGFVVWTVHIAGVVVTVVAGIIVAGILAVVTGIMVPGIVIVADITLVVAVARTVALIGMMDGHRVVMSRSVIVMGRSVMRRMSVVALIAVMVVVPARLEVEHGIGMAVVVVGYGMAPNHFNLTGSEIWQEAVVIDAAHSHRIGSIVHIVAIGTVDGFEQHGLSHVESHCCNQIYEGCFIVGCCHQHGGSHYGNRGGHGVGRYDNGGRTGVHNEREMYVLSVAQSGGAKKGSCDENHLLHNCKF